MKCPHCNETVKGYSANGRMIRCEFCAFGPLPISVPDWEKAQQEPAQPEPEESKPATKAKK